jgi:RHS repeat-associated protein
MTYDDNGNLRTLKEAGQTTTYTWDPRDRLVGLTGPGLSASFAYDAIRRRTRKTINAFGTDFQYDGVDIVKEIAGGATINYLRGLRIDEPLARIEDGGTFCYTPDALNTTVALSDGTGGIPTEYTYEPFGRATPSGAASGNAFQFTGRENDGAGEYYYRARYYTPNLARFTSEDPIGIVGGVNLYAYVGNGPLNFRDPSGLRHPECDDLMNAIVMQWEIYKTCGAADKLGVLKELQRLRQRAFDLGCFDDEGGPPPSPPPAPAPAPEREREKVPQEAKATAGAAAGALALIIIWRLIRLYPPLLPLQLSPI